MKNVVYILGAGASKDFGLPLGTEFFLSAYNLLESQIESTFRHEFESTQNEIEKYMHYIYLNLAQDKSNYPNFEEILTFIWDSYLSEKWDNDKMKLITIFKNDKGAKEVFDSFIKFMSMVLLGSMEINNDNGNFYLLKKFICGLPYKKESISFISFNYDILLDILLQESIMKGIIPDFTYAIPLFDFDNYQSGNIKETMFAKIGGGEFKRLFSKCENHCNVWGVPLLKPHGSLNLYYCNHSQAEYGDGFYVKNISKVSDWKSSFSCPSCKRTLKPLIIPPLYNKNSYLEKTSKKVSSSRRYHEASVIFDSYPQNFRHLIDPIMINLLSEADEIIIIGYSMQPYDIDFKSILMQGLIKNKKRDSVNLKIITKGDSENLKLKFNHLVGNTSILGNNGFLDFLKSNIIGLKK